MQKKYQTLARRYRPQKFTEVVGQESVVKTLKNAIRLNRSAHAYLFSGSRGIGKTTLARLYAKALNCSNLTEDIEPCNHCQSCLEIASSSSLDVIEIDGASNRGIDDIRQINETIGYAPSSGKYKIYIIDEVHMLTKEAFNALLKTLEEPPAPIKFFFATTEPHKVPATIISRCQRFDLLRISHSEVVDKLKSISQEIERNVEMEALHTIAHFSEGSLRDAESLLDQLLCFEEGTVSSEVVNKTLGIIPTHYFFELDKAVEKEDISFAFSFVEKIYHAGKDLSYFIEELVTHFRHLLLAKMNHSLPQLTDNLQKMYHSSAAGYQKDQLLFLLDYLLQAQQHLQKSPFKRVTVEMILLQIIRSKMRVSLPSLVHRLIELEKKLTSTPNETALQPALATAKTEVPLSQNRPSPTPVNVHPKPVEKSLPQTSPSAELPTAQQPKVAQPQPSQPLPPKPPAPPLQQTTFSTPPQVKAPQQPTFQSTPVTPPKPNPPSPELQPKSPPPQPQAPRPQAPQVQAPSQHTFQKAQEKLSTIQPPTKPDEKNFSLSSHKLQPVPFLQKKEEIDASDRQEKKKQTKENLKHPSHYDTLMRFAAHELDGTVLID